MSFTVGQTVRYTGEMIERQGLWRVTVIESGSGFIAADPLSGQTAVITGTAPWRFEAVDNDWQVGDVTTIVGDHHNGDPHGLDLDTTVRVVSTPSGAERLAVKPVEGDEGDDWTYYVESRDLAPKGAPAAPAETLESFKIKFVEGAKARARANESNRPAEVDEALAGLYALEFTDPSKTLEDFQKRVVAVAMEAKAKYSWCPEPESFLTDIGLGHLLPVTKKVRITVEVTVTADAGTSDRAIRNQALVQAQDALPTAYAHSATII